jgi:Uma2 family endonuclease
VNLVAHGQIAIDETTRPAVRQLLPGKGTTPRRSVSPSRAPGSAGMVPGVRAPEVKATYEDLERLPANVTGELVDGELILSPRPAGPHVLAASVLASELGGPFQQGRGGPGGWWILSEPELWLGEDVLVPDLAGWKRERMPRIPEGVGFEVVPDWICEVLSPSTARLDLTSKLPGHARGDAGHLWLVDPANQVVEVFRLEAQRWALVAAGSGEDRLRAEPFEEVELELGR